MTPKQQRDLGFGLSIKDEHIPYIIEHKPQVDFFEIISENYMSEQDEVVERLLKIRKDYPIVMHGVSLGLGNTNDFDPDYLRDLKKLISLLNPTWVSDHLCWTGIDGYQSFDLLPLPYTKESLQHLVNRIQKIQDILGRQFVIENPSTYIEYTESEMSELDFINELLQKADCLLLLDINNVFVGSYNHGFDPYHYLQNIDTNRVIEFHLAGYRNLKTYLFDTHSQPVSDEVWDMYRFAVKRFGKISTILEWDADIPEFTQLQSELHKAKDIAEKLSHES